MFSKVKIFSSEIPKETGKSFISPLAWIFWTKMSGIFFIVSLFYRIRFKSKINIWITYLRVECLKRHKNNNNYGNIQTVVWKSCKETIKTFKIIKKLKLLRPSCHNWRLIQNTFRRIIFFPSCTALAEMKCLMFFHENL